MVVIFLAIVTLSGYISLASILSALILPIGYWAVYHPARELLIATILAGLLVVYRHKGNIERLRAGTESVFSLKGRGGEPHLRFGCGQLGQRAGDRPRATF